LRFSASRSRSTARFSRARSRTATLASAKVTTITLAASPILSFTADEVWEHHAALKAEAPSVHLAEWPRDERPAAGEGPWELLLSLRDVVNAGIEPLKAAKTVGTSNEVDAVVEVRSDVSALVGLYGPELAGFLMVAKLELRFNAFSPTDQSDRPEAEFRLVSVEKTAFTKCDRCWTYRDDVQSEGERAVLCSRCVTALAER